MNFEKDKKEAFLPKDPERCSPSVPRETRSGAVGWWWLFMQWAEQRTELVLFCLNAAQKAVKISKSFSDIPYENVNYFYKIFQ